MLSELFEIGVNMEAFPSGETLMLKWAGLTQPIKKVQGRKIRPSFKAGYINHLFNVPTQWLKETSENCNCYSFKKMPWLPKESNHCNSKTFLTALCWVMLKNKEPYNAGIPPKK